MKPALLLNATYEPLAVVSWKKAITMVLVGKAQPIEHHDRHVRSASDSWLLPSVLRLFRRVKIPKRHIAFTRRNVYKRDNFECQYCGEKFPPADLTFDHVFPQSRGGETDWENIVTACQPCNRIKGDRTPREADMPLESEPKEPQWWPFSENSVQLNDHPESWKPYLWI